MCAEGCWRASVSRGVEQGGKGLWHARDVGGLCESLIPLVCLWNVDSHVGDGTAEHTSGGAGAVC